MARFDSEVFHTVDVGASDGWPIFSNLTPGARERQTDVLEESGSWLDRLAMLTPDIPLEFVRSRSFEALGAMGLAAILYLVYRLRVTQLLERQRRLLEKLNERERVARELHDTLLQGTQALILKVHVAAKIAGKDEPIHQMLNQVVEQATQAMVEARNRVQDLRAQPGTDDDLATQLVQFGHDLVQGGAPEFNAFVEGSSRELAPAALREVGLIGREALLNAFYHSNAQLIELQIDFTDGCFRLTVRDDGVGFDDTALCRPAAGRHWGLPGTQERARVIASEIRIWSRQGAGTELQLRVPASVAYVRNPQHLRWATLRRMSGYPA